MHLLLFVNIGSDIFEVEQMNASPEVGRKVLAKIGISIEKAVELCSNTINQSKEPLWYAERSIRITASKFGQIIKRRKSIEPMSILKNILKANN